MVPAGAAWHVPELWDGLTLDAKRLHNRFPSATGNAWLQQLATRLPVELSAGQVFRGLFKVGSPLADEFRHGHQPHHRFILEGNVLRPLDD